MEDAKTKIWCVDAHSSVKKMVLIFMSGGNKKEIKSKAQAMKIDSCSQLSRFRVPFCDFISFMYSNTKFLDNFKQ